jgi:hypothetical protein
MIPEKNLEVYYQVGTRFEFEQGQVLTSPGRSDGPTRSCIPDVSSSSSSRFSRYINGSSPFLA